MARQGEVGLGKAGPGEARQGSRGRARLGKVRHGLAWLGKAVLGREFAAGHGKAGQGKEHRLSGPFARPVHGIGTRRNPLMSAAFDIIAAARRLEDASLSCWAAEAVTASDPEASGAERDALATKANLETCVAALETRLTNRLYAVAGAIVRAVFASAVALAAAILQPVSGP